MRRLGWRWRAAVAAGAVTAGVAAALVVWRSQAGGPAAHPPVTGPVILISIDTLRADRLPVYGYRQIRTPALDGFASDAVLFERAYAHAPQTLPSHTSILSGQLPFEHGVRDNLGFTVRPDVRLLPEMLSSHGFTTAGIVSSYVLRAEVGLGRAFDFYDSQMPAVTSERSIGQVQRSGLESLVVAERWLDRRTTDHFFLFFHLYEPHTPYTPPARYAHAAPYDGEVEFADEIVGRLLDTLRNRGLYDPAVIILLSDHGEGLGDHGELEHGVFVYDEAIRVPLIIKLPGGWNGGMRVAQAVQHIDLVPTVLDLVGVPRPDGLHGRSLRPLLEEPGTAIAEQGIYAEGLYSRYHFGWSELLALTGSRYRFIEAPREELYDLQRDPEERRNVAAERPQTTRAMRAALDRLVAGRPLDTPSAVSPEDRERLRALGYIGTSAAVAPEVNGTDLPDPKDQIGVLADYRRALKLAGRREFLKAIDLITQILADHPGMADLWQRLGNLQVRAGRDTDSVASYRRLVALKPSSPTALVAVAGSLLKLKRLDEAWDHAALAVSAAAGADPRIKASPHEMLVRIALARGDAEAARRQAAMAREADPRLPLPTYVRARLLYARQRYADALPLFQETLRQLRARGVTLVEVHFYTADTLARLQRNEEAEAEFREELRLFPSNGRVRASLAMLYRSEGKDDAVEQTIDNLLEMMPTPAGYGLAAQLWTIFGEPGRAAAVRASARERFQGDPASSELETPRP